MTKMQSILLTNDNNMSVEIINLGARIKSIKFPLDGRPTEMIVGYASAEQYVDDPFYLGATCGRVCNRISQAKFELGSVKYQLSRNDGENCLHGGSDNFAMRYWQVDSDSQTDCSVTLSLVSRDGDQGFPGTLSLNVTYQLSSDNKLSIQYGGITDRATPVNITNHAYFNLGEADCQLLSLQLLASNYLESDQQNLPTGKLLSVTGTDYDFTTPAATGHRQRHSTDSALLEKNGFDHCFVLDQTPLGHPQAILTSSRNKVRLNVYTDQRAIQLYTGYHLAGEFIPYQGLCLEAQNFTDADNQPHFPSNMLQPNQEYRQQITFGFEGII